MKILLLGAYHIWPMLEYELDILQREIDSGNQVIYLKCSSNVETCPANNPQPEQVFNKIICIECKSRLNNGLNWLGLDKIQVIDYDGYISNEQKIIIDNVICNLEIADVSDWSMIIYKEFKTDIFDSAVSQLMTTCRESKPNLELNKRILLSFLRTGMISELAGENAIQNHKPSKVYIYNGRLPRYRSLLRICQNKSIESVVFEYPRFKHERYILTKNTFIHDRLKVSDQIRSKSFGVGKRSDGEIWLNNKVGRVKQSSEPVYTLNQKISTIPDGWNPYNFNVSFFLTSEYEIAGVKEWLDTRIYSSQAAGIIQIVESLRGLPNIFFYVRIHPNLVNKDINFTEIINGIKYNNLLVIAADSPNDSYELAKKSNLVITFGSTIGIEAAFLGSHVALLSAAFYSSYDCCFKPKSHDELIRGISLLYAGNSSYFPEIQKAKNEAINFASDFINFGVNPLYLNKMSIRTPVLIRDNSRYALSANLTQKLVTRLYIFFIKLRKLKDYKSYNLKKFKSLIGTFFTQVPR